MAYPFPGTRTLSDSTQIGIGGPAFPSTSWSMVRAATNPDLPQRQERLQALLSTYWKPVYHFIRHRWRKSNEDAKDLTQGFFVLLLEGRYLERLIQEHGSLRGYLKAALHHFLVDDERRREALKRGGERGVVPLDLSEAEESVPDPRSDSPEAAFDREWIATCLSDGVRRLEEELVREGREKHFRIFRLYYLEPARVAAGSGPEPSSSYEAVARELGLAPHDVANSLVYTRRRLRAILKERLSDTAASDEAAAAELRFVLGE